MESPFPFPHERERDKVMNLHIEITRLYYELYEMFLSNNSIEIQKCNEKIELLEFEKQQLEKQFGI